MAKRIRTHETLEGDVVRYEEPAPEVARFLDRVVALANDPRVTEDELVELIYSTENPILDHTLFEGRGAVTREVFEDPLYRVLTDWLGRKRVQLGRLDMGTVRAAATLSVAEAAAEIGVTPSAVRQAIQARRLAAVKVGRAWRLDPRDVAAFEPAPRGPEASPALELRIGNVEGKSFRIKIPGFEETARKGRVVDGTVRSFRRGAIAFSGQRTNRMFVIEPSEASNEFRWGPFYVRGRYQVVRKINDAKEASQAFKAFEPGDDRRSPAPP